jgi:hypothetical protein
MLQVVKTSKIFKIKRRLICVFHLLFNYKRYKSGIIKLLAFIIEELYISKSKISKIPLNALTKKNDTVNLSIDIGRDGNTTYYEQIALASLVKFYNPKKILEVGTFNGRSTLTMALNTPSDTFITTVDLPPNQSDFSNVLDVDLPFIKDKQKLSRLYNRDSIDQRVRQIYADSTQCDFSSFQKDSELFDFIFIDAGHSYMCVKNDTEKALKVLSSKGIILWHDFTPNCLGVFEYLNSLKSSIPLSHIENTSFVIYQKS